MPLTPNDTRCAGVWSRGFCSRRESCARFTERHNAGPYALFRACMCPGLNGYWEFFIPLEKAE